MTDLRGKTIAIEGIDGCGKQTQVELLHKYLESKGYSVKVLSFPNYKFNSSILVRNYLAGEFGDLYSLNEIQASTLFAVDRMLTLSTEHVHRHLLNGGVVVYDRYMLSNVIHQLVKAIKRSPEKQFLELESTIEKILNCDYALGNNPADINIILEISIETYINNTMERVNKITGGVKKDIHESSIEYMKQCISVLKLIKEGLDSRHICESRILPIQCDYECGKMRSIENINNEIIGLL